MKIDNKINYFVQLVCALKRTLHNNKKQMKMGKRGNKNGD
jgi:hypothetical protein